MAIKMANKRNFTIPIQGDVRGSGAEVFEIGVI